MVSRYPFCFPRSFFARRRLGGCFSLYLSLVFPFSFSSLLSRANLWPNIPSCYVVGTRGGLGRGKREDRVGGVYEVAGCGKIVRHEQLSGRECGGSRRRSGAKEGFLRNSGKIIGDWRRPSELPASGWGRGAAQQQSITGSPGRRPTNYYCASTFVFIFASVSTSNSTAAVVAICKPSTRAIYPPIPTTTTAEPGRSTASESPCVSIDRFVRRERTNDRPCSSLTPPPLDNNESGEPEPLTAPVE